MLLSAWSRGTSRTLRWALSSCCRTAANSSTMVSYSRHRDSATLFSLPNSCSLPCNLRRKSSSSAACRLFSARTASKSAACACSCIAAFCLWKVSWSSSISCPKLFLEAAISVCCTARSSSRRCKRSFWLRNVDTSSSTASFSRCLDSAISFSERYSCSLEASLRRRSSRSAARRDRSAWWTCWSWLVVSWCCCSCLASSSSKERV
mmetsp:Transcript_27638/g.62947  ORF Transcript_27638/g.62947 Transcript_27638/m.62947 type:complete len:206 (-) Transcript_27638:47-664(-)